MDLKELKTVYSQLLGLVSVEGEVVLLAPLYQVLSQYSL